MTRTVKNAIAACAAAFPESTFTLAPGRRGVRYIKWKGGPEAAAVRAVCYHLLPKKILFYRVPTQAESAERQAQWEREDAERKANEPARRAAAKAAGIEKRKATIARRKELAAVLVDRWPGIAFELRHRFDDWSVYWTGGPTESEVSEATGLVKWACRRADSAEDIETQHAAPGSDEAAAPARRAHRMRSNLARLAARARPIAAHRITPQLPLPLRLPRDWSTVAAECAMIRKINPSALAYPQYS